MTIVAHANMMPERQPLSRFRLGTWCVVWHRSHAYSDSEVLWNWECRCVGVDAGVQPQAKHLKGLHFRTASNALEFDG